MRRSSLASVAALGLLFVLPHAARAQSADWDSVDSSDDDGQSQPVTPPPGKIVVRLNGRFRFYGGLFDDQQFNRTYNTTTYSLSPTTIDINGKPTSIFTYKTTTTLNSNKQADYGFIEYLRLYPGFDGQSANGIRYGASAEIRQDNLAAPGGGANGSVSGADVFRGSLYVRREWGYIGTADLGTVRFGTVDGPNSLFLTGTFENFNDGGFNGDVRYGLLSAARLQWPFPDDGNAYATNKLMYLSPQFMGFDFGVGFEPSTAGANIDDGSCSFASTSNTLAVTNGSNTIGTAPANQGYQFGGIGCDRTESTTVSAESARRRNTVDAVVRFRTTFDGFGLVATAGYIGGSHVAYTGPYYTVSSVKVGTVTENSYTRPVTYNGLSLGEFGVALTYGGLQVGGNYMVGRFNNAFASGSSAALEPTPVGAKPADAWIAGTSYTFGPAIVGASWTTVDSQGAYAYSSGLLTPTASEVTRGLGSRREEGLNAGGTLKVAPGLGMFLTYLWDERKQNGYDFVSSAIGATTNNKVRAQALTLGTSLTW